MYSFLWILYKNIVTIKNNTNIFNSLLGQQLLKSIFINKPKNIKLAITYKN